MTTRRGVSFLQPNSDKFLPLYPLLKVSSMSYKPRFAPAVLAALLALGASTLSAQTACNQVTLFSVNDDLNPPSPCIVDYYGGSQLLAGTNGCDGWSYGMSTGGGYITIGPVQWGTRISFDYYATNNGQIRVEYTDDWRNPYISNSPLWTEIAYFQPARNVCTNYTSTVQIPAGYYYRISQPPGTANGSGPLKLFLRNISSVDPLPVELTAFTAARIGGMVKLRWNTASEKNSLGFHIERSASIPDAWQTIGFAAGHGNTTTPQQYEFTDLPGLASGVVRYRLRQVDRDGSYEYSPVVNVSFGGVAAFGLQNAYPNPFNPGTTLSFALKRDARVTLKIVDEGGRDAAVLIDNEALGAGSYARYFNAGALPSGLYYAWMFSDEESSILPLNLTK
jgi:hypothetical protein